MHGFKEKIDFVFGVIASERYSYGSGFQRSHGFVNKRRAVKSSPYAYIVLSG